MKRIYIITGANGHLGRAVIRLLLKTGSEIRGLILPGDTEQLFDDVCYTAGDVTDAGSLIPLFQNTAGAEVFVIHAAGIVDISWELVEQVHRVNVKGTENILSLCVEYKVRRLLYVSSVHAIPEKGHTGVLREVARFSPEEVRGGYAKSKAEASQAVLDAAEKGLDAVIVHPSGMLGPDALSGSYLMQLVEDYLDGLLPACVRGGYDFVDVRDVADGCLLALEKGGAGECYILSNRHYEICDVIRILRETAGGRRLPVLPIWMARAACPAIGLWFRRKDRRPLYTRYSLYTLQSNGRFSHDKAASSLGYTPRDIRSTLEDTVCWLRDKGHPVI